MRALPLLVAGVVAFGAAEATGGDRAAPLMVNVSEVSKDGHPIHNRLTFDCHFDDGPREIDCAVVQQDLQEPTVVTREQQDKQLAEIGDVLKSCKEYEHPPTDGEGSPTAKVFARASAACKAKDRVALTAMFHDVMDIANTTCHLLSVVRDERFRKVDDDTWSLEPNPVPTCENIRITGVLKRDSKEPHEWNYTETVVAKPPPKDFQSLCTAKSQTTRFAWRKAFTEEPVGCRYVAM